LSARRVQAVLPQESLGGSARRPQRAERCHWAAGIHDPAIDHEAWIMRELLGDSWEDYLVPTAEVDEEQDWWICNPPF
jgi:hypothetical protein